VLPHNIDSVLWICDHRLLWHHFALCVQSTSGHSNLTKGRIAAAHGWYSLYITIGRSFLPQNCPFSPVIWTPIKYVVPWAHPSPRHKWHLRKFSCFCRAHDCDRQTTLLRLYQQATSTYLVRAMQPKNCKVEQKILSNKMWSWTSPTQRYCHHGRESDTRTTLRPAATC